MCTVTHVTCAITPSSCAKCRIYTCDKTLWQLLYQQLFRLRMSRMCLYVENVSFFVMQAYHHVHVCVCVCACVCTCRYVFACVRVCVCVLSLACVCMLGACVCVCVCVCVSVCACVCVCAVCVCVCVCVVFQYVYVICVPRVVTRVIRIYMSERGFEWVASLLWGAHERAFF